MDCGHQGVRGETCKTTRELKRHARGTTHMYPHQGCGDGMAGATQDNTTRKGPVENLAQQQSSYKPPSYIIHTPASHMHKRHTVHTNRPPSRASFAAPAKARAARTASPSSAASARCPPGGPSGPLPRWTRTGRPSTAATSSRGRRRCRCCWRPPAPR